MFLAYYMHRIDPVIFEVTDVIKLRWYGVAYVAAFVAGYYLLRWWAKRGIGELKENQVADFMTWAAIFGVLIGGRLGWVLLYGIRQDHSGDPWWWIRVWEGGMASHGGILGLFFFTLYWARTRRQSWTGLGDNLVVAAPLGLFFGRMANFINGELYGRPTTVPWAMKFPEEATHWKEGDPQFAAVSNLLYEWKSSGESITHLARTDDAFAAKLSELLTPRHPSQLYAGALEGLALFAILFFVREKWPRAPHGLITSLFFILYAVFRITDEQFREPDRYIAGLTEGQFYSVFMIVIGAAFLIFALRRRTKAAA